MMTIERIQHTLKTRNLTTVARETKLPYFRLYRFANGTTVKPAHHLVMTLSNYLEKTK